MTDGFLPLEHVALFKNQISEIIQLVRENTARYPDPLITDADQTSDSRPPRSSSPVTQAPQPESEPLANQASELKSQSVVTQESPPQSSSSRQGAREGNEPVDLNRTFVNETALIEATTGIELACDVSANSSEAWTSFGLSDTVPNGQETLSNGFEMVLSGVEAGLHRCEGGSFSTELSSDQEYYTPVGSPDDSRRNSLDSTVVSFVLLFYLF